MSCTLPSLALAAVVATPSAPTELDVDLLVGTGVHGAEVTRLAAMGGLRLVVDYRGFVGGIEAVFGGATPVELFSDAGDRFDFDLAALFGAAWGTRRTEVDLGAKLGTRLASVTALRTPFEPLAGLYVGVAGRSRGWRGVRLGGWLHFDVAGNSVSTGIGPGATWRVLVVGSVGLFWRARHTPEAPYDATDTPRD